MTKPDRGILVAHQRGRIIYVDQINTDKNAYAFSIQKEIIHDDGIVHLTLFNSKGEPQCERIVYINKSEPLHITIKPDKNVYKPRDKVTIDVTVTDVKGAPVTGEFSLTATNSHQVIHQRYEENIKSYLLLSSDIQSLNKRLGSEVKGLIEEPGYYFDRNNVNTEFHLDILMMTQGWRRFLWPQILRDSVTPLQFAFEKGITISGQVLLPNRKPAKKAIELIVLLGEGVLTEKADANGRFVLHNLNINDSTTIVIQGTKSNGSKNVDVQLDNPFIPKVQPITESENSLFNREDLNDWLKRKREYEEMENSFRLSNVQTLKAVEVEATREESDSRRTLYGTPSKTLKVDNKLCAGALNVLQMLQGRFAGIQVSGSGLDMSVSIRGQRAGILIDGTRLSDPTALSLIPPCSIEFIDVVMGPSVIADAPGGLISFLTKRGNGQSDWSNEKAEGIAVTKVVGFDIPRQFYSPRYENPDAKLTLPDLRPTLFWKPDIKTDASGKATVTFWNSNEQTTVHINVEGISITGKPVTGNMDYNVN